MKKLKFNFKQKQKILKNFEKYGFCTLLQKMKILFLRHFLYLTPFHKCVKILYLYPFTDMV